MKRGSKISNPPPAGGWCGMCGTTAGEPWETVPTRRARLGVVPRHQDEGRVWCVCDECESGLVGLYGPPRVVIWN